LSAQQNIDPWLTAPVLEGRHVTLRPLVAGDAAGLVEAAREGELWSMAITVIPGPDSAETYIAKALQLQEQGLALPFVIVERATGTILGSSRFMDMDRPNLKLEIGATFIARRAQGTRVNPEIKLLMLTQAFEVMGCNRVMLQTDERNLHSQAAIEKLGATREGVMRHDRIMADGFVRNSVRYSIIAEEWPAVKAGLLARVG